MPDTIPTRNPETHPPTEARPRQRLFRGPGVLKVRVKVRGVKVDFSLSPLLADQIGLHHGSRVTAFWDDELFRYKLRHKAHYEQTREGFQVQRRTTGNYALVSVLYDREAIDACGGEGNWYLTPLIRQEPGVTDIILPSLVSGAGDDDTHSSVRQLLLGCEQKLKGIGTDPGLPDDTAELKALISRANKMLAGEYAGVRHHNSGNCWSAHVIRGGRPVYLGYYQNEHQAAFAVNVAELLLNTTWGLLNHIAPEDLPDNPVQDQIRSKVEIKLQPKHTSV